MKKILLSTVLVLAFAATSYAIPVRTAEMGQVPARDYSPAQDVCYIGYYNFCSGWVFYWSGYCYCLWGDTGLEPKYGTCFDLADCPDDCRHLLDFWWGCKRFTTYGDVTLEVFCGQDCCPVGAPLAVFPHYNPDVSTAWQYFFVGDVPVCECDAGGQIIVMVTDHGMGVHTSAYSDINSANIDAACELEWRCSGHSFVYQNCVDYCATYGAPGPMWVSGATYGCTNYPAIPPGCHNYLYPTGFFTEFLIDVYISCLGATATDDNSWSEIKALYK
jgi:hypothetical protein